MVSRRSPIQPAAADGERRVPDVLRQLRVRHSGISDVRCPLREIARNLPAGRLQGEAEPGVLARGSVKLTASWKPASWRQDGGRRRLARQRQRTLAIRRTCLTGGDTILTWMNVKRKIFNFFLRIVRYALLGATVKFCSECGAPVSSAPPSRRGRTTRVTRPIADVVHRWNRGGRRCQNGCAKSWPSWSSGRQRW